MIGEDGMVYIQGPDGKSRKINLKDLTYETLGEMQGLLPAMVATASDKVGNTWNHMFESISECINILRAHGQRVGLEDVVKIMWQDLMAPLKRLHGWYIGYFTSLAYDYTIPDGERKQIKDLVQRYQLGINDVLLHTLVSNCAMVVYGQMTELGGAYRRLSDILRNTDVPCTCEACQKEHKDPSEYRDSCIHACHGTWESLETHVAEALSEMVDPQLVQRTAKEHSVFQRLCDEGLNPHESLIKTLQQLRGPRPKRTKVDVNQKLPDLPDLDKLFDIK